MEYNNITIGEYLYIKGRIGWKGLKKSEYLNNGEYRIINGKSVTGNGIDWNECGYISKERFEESPEIILKKNDIVITKDGTIGKVDIIEDLDFPTTVASGLFILRNTKEKEINTKFIYYFLKSEEFKKFIEMRKEGSVIPHLYQRDFSQLTLPNLSIKKQNNLVSILDNISEKINNNNVIINNLEQISQTLFKRWFIDFEFPNEEGKPYKSSGGEMVESELGEIPKGWEVIQFGDITEIQNGFAFRADDYVSNGIKVIRTVNISKSDITIDNETVYLPESYSHSIKFEKYKLKQFDTLLVMVGGSIGNTGIIFSYNTPALQNQNQWRMRSKNINISSVLIFYYTNYINDRVSGWKSGSAREFYRKDTFNKFNIAIPNLETIECLDKILVANFEKMDLLHKEINILKELRDTLLPKLLSGEIEIPEDLEV